MTENSVNCIPCGVRSFTRNTYFNGKPLLERDFNDEQAYMVGKDWLHNNLLHGVGTVCGLKVSPHPNPACRNRFVYIEPGMALDCCGHEVIVAQRQLVRVQELITENEIDLAGEPQDLFIAICYDECLEEPIPVMLPTCDCADGDQGYNRVRETARVHLFARPAGEQLPARPPLDPRLEWLNTLTLEEQSPRAVAVDSQLGHIYVAAQNVTEADEGARLYVFDSITHNIITAVDAAREPTGIALSLLGDRIYLAAAEWNEGSPFGIAAFEEASIRTSPDPAAVIDVDEPVRLVVSSQTGALFALLLQTGRLWSWSDEAIRNWLDEPTPSSAGPDGRLELDLSADFTGATGAAERGASLMSITNDGRYLFLADATNGVRVVDVATFTEVTPATMDAFGQPLALRTSNDSEYVYVLWEGEGDAAGNGLLTRYRIDDDSGSLELVREGRGGQWPGAPLDLAIAPAERFAYVLQRDDDLSQVMVLSVDEIAATATDDPVDPRVAREDIAGEGRHQHLNLLGRRLYVAADEPAEDAEDTARGLVAVLDVNENACDDIFGQLINGCPACDDGEDDHCVVLAHFPSYIPDAPMVAGDEAAEGDNVIDNLTHRPLVPSSNTIVDVIRCMLEQGFVEGVAGPRGPAGEAGVDGERGAGVTEATAAPLPSGTPPSATLIPIAGDPEGDFRLELGIPVGPEGDPGPRGPGIVEAEATTLPPNTSATATLVPIAGDPEGDQRLLLGIPQGEPGDTPPPPKLAHIDALSWLHNEEMDRAIFEELIVDPEAKNPDPGLIHESPGLVISFDQPVLIETIFEGQDMETRSEIFQLFVRFFNQNTGLFCECIVPNAIYQAVKVDSIDAEGRINQVTLLEAAATETEAVRLVFEETAFPNIDADSFFFRVLFRADFVLRGEDRTAVDGNFIGGELPTGNGSEGDSFESWFRVA